jgi:uncharacterized damage-inducible protein DinB
MNSLLEKQFNQLEEERRQLFRELKIYDDAVINKKPAPGKWSVAEVIAHLITAEEMSLQYLMKKTQDTSRAEKETFKNKWRWLLVKIVFSANIKYKAPQIVEPKSGYESLANLEMYWTKIRLQTLSVLNKLSDDELNKELWKHAIAGKMNLHHMVKFFRIHFRRHKKQIARTLAAVN